MRSCKRVVVCSGVPGFLMPQPRNQILNRLNNRCDIAKIRLVDEGCCAFFNATKKPLGCAQSDAPDDVVAARVTSRVSAGHPQLAIGGVELQVSGRREPVA
eukprot:478999-Rhodomonas_salina.4